MSLGFLGGVGALVAALPKYVPRNSSAVELTIVENADRILMNAPKLRRVYSRWDKRNQRALSPYGHTMAGEVRSHFASVTRKRSANENILMLGLGGGTIAARCVTFHGRGAL